MGLDYKIISREYANRILDSPGEKYEPYGKFLVEEMIDGEAVWTAIDNSDGEAFTEEFKTRHAAVRWLHGYTVTDRFGEMHEGNHEQQRGIHR
jgi:hypothetical protein